MKYIAYSSAAHPSCTARNRKAEGSSNADVWNVWKKHHTAMHRVSIHCARVCTSDCALPVPLIFRVPCLFRIPHAALATASHAHFMQDFRTQRYSKDWLFTVCQSLTVVLDTSSLQWLEIFKCIEATLSARGAGDGPLLALFAGGATCRGSRLRLHGRLRTPNASRRQVAFKKG